MERPDVLDQGLEGCLSAHRLCHDPGMDVRVALFQLAAEKLALQQVIDIEVNGASTTVTAARGAPCPDLVYPNYEDWGFLQVSLDPASLASLRQHEGRLDEAQSILEATVPLMEQHEEGGISHLT